MNQVFDVSFNQNMLYNSDRSQPNSSYTSASNYQLTSAFGAKFNVWEELQLWLQAFYTYNALTGPPTTAQQYQLYQQNQIGTMATVGLTY